MHGRPELQRRVERRLVIQTVEASTAMTGAAGVRVTSVKRTQTACVSKMDGNAVTSL